MEKNEKIRLSEEELQKRMFLVDDKKLFGLKKIYFSQIEQICRTALEKAKCVVGEMKLNWLNISSQCPFVEELRFYDSFCGLPCLFTFEVIQGEQRYLAVYALYSSYVYLLKDSSDGTTETSEYVEGIRSEALLRLNVRYFFAESHSNVYKYVYLYARVGKVQKTFWLRRPSLLMLVDFSARKTVDINKDNLLRAFNNAYLFSEVFRSSELFSLTSQNRKQ